jgi:hypothetical protein
MVSDAGRYVGGDGILQDAHLCAADVETHLIVRLKENELSRESCTVHETVTGPALQKPDIPLLIARFCSERRYDVITSAIICAVSIRHLLPVP